MNWNPGINTRPVAGKWYRVGEVGVDTAAIRLADPHCGDRLNADGEFIDENGEQVSVTVRTGSDGIYSVFVQYDESLCVSEIRILSDGGASRDNGEVPQ
jgi:hypothetical protein